MTRTIARAEVDDDIETWMRERDADPLGVDRFGGAAIEHDQAADGDTAAIEGEGRAAPAQRGDDAAPVGIAAVDGGLDERALGNDTRRDTGLVRVGGPVHRDAKVPCRALGVGDELLGERITDLEERAFEGVRRARALGKRRTARGAVGEQDARVVGRRIAVNRDAVEGAVGDT